MLDTLRKNSRNKLIYVLFGIIILVFVFSFGPGSGSCRSGSMTTGSLQAAEVNGKVIHALDYQRSYQRTFRDYQSQTGGAFDEAMAQRLGIGAQVLDRMIEGELLNQLAAENGIRVSDRELSAELAKIPSFQKDGVFDPEQYHLMVTRQMGSNVTRFEDDMRASLLTQKFVAGLAASAQASDDEVRADFIKQHEKVDLDFVRFPAARFEKEITPATDAQAEAFLKDNAARAEEWYKNNGYKLKLAEQKEFKDVQNDVAKRMLDEEAAKKLAEAKAKEALASIQAGKKLAELFPAKDETATTEEGAEAPLAVENTGPFSPSADYIPRIGSEATLASAALALTDEKPAPDKVFEVNDAFVVVALKHREHADLEELANKKDELREELRTRKAETALQTLLDVAKAKADIWRNETLPGIAPAALAVPVPAEE